MVLLARLKKAAESRPLSVRLEAAFQALNRAQEKVGVKPYEESK